MTKDQNDEGDISIEQAVSDMRELLSDAAVQKVLALFEGMDHAVKLRLADRMAAAALSAAPAARGDEMSSPRMRAMFRFMAYWHALDRAGLLDEAGQVRSDDWAQVAELHEIYGIEALH